MNHIKLIERLADSLDEVINPYPLAKSEVNADVAAAREYLAAPEQSEPPRFPTMLRKMWSGGEVQHWINENWHPAPKAGPVNQMLLDKLKGASNYIDKLGGVSQPYRQAIAAAEQAQGAKT